MLLEAGDFVVLNLDDNILTNQGKRLMMDLNGNAIQTLTWDTSTDCETLNHGMGGQKHDKHCGRPRSRESLIHSYDGSMTIKFTRVMQKHHLDETMIGLKLPIQERLGST